MGKEGEETTIKVRKGGIRERNRGGHNSVSMMKQFLLFQTRKRKQQLLEKGGNQEKDSSYVAMAVIYIYVCVSRCV